MNNSPVCVGNNFILTGAGGTEYNWVKGNAGFSGNPLILGASNESSGIYKLTVTNAVGCTATTSTVVSVLAAPIPIISANNINPCVGTALNLSVSGGGSYFWSGPINFSSTLQNPVITNTTISQSGTYVVNVTNIGGCTATKTIAISINDKPSLIITNPASVAPPITVNITSNAITTGSTLPSGTILSYFTDANATNTLENPSTILVSGTYYVKATTPNGCFDIKPIVVQIGNCNNAPVNLISTADNINAQTIQIKTTDIITANNKITGNANVLYRSGKSILLTPENGGFTVANGSVFKAEIGGCQ